MTINRWWRSRARHDAGRDHVAMPGRLHEGDPLRFCETWMLRPLGRIAGGGGGLIL